MRTDAQYKVQSQCSGGGSRVKVALAGALAISLLTFGFILVLQSPVQAFVSKGTSCSASSCHGATNAAATINVALNGTPGTAITAVAGSTFEVDWIYSNMLTNASRYSGTNPEIALPSGWTIARGTSNSPSLTGWSTTWDLTGGVTSGWNTTYSTTTEFPGSPVGYAIDYTGTTWDNGSRNAAFDDGSSGDLDGTANIMGADARITVPAGTSPGTYTFMILGIGHDAANAKAHVEQTITVTVPDIAAPTVNTFTMPATASSLTVNVSAFTASDNVAVTGYKITESATAPLPGDAGWTSSAPTNFTFSGSGTKIAYAWAKDAAGYVSTSRSATVNITVKQDQSITVIAPAPASAAYNSQFTVAATASSGLTVTYSSGSSGICTNSGATFTMVSGTGTCIVQYDQAGNTTYNAASRVTSNSMATKINQTTVTVSVPTSAFYQQSALSATASGGSGTGAYSYSTGASTACTVTPSTGALTITSGTGSCSITATRAMDGNYNISATSSPASVTINKATQAIVTVSAPANAYYGQTGLSVAAAGGSGSGAYSYDATGSTACTVNASTGVLAITSGSGSCSITATRATDSNYNGSATSAPATVAVTKAIPNVTAWPTASAISYGQTLADSTLSSGAATPVGSFAFTVPTMVPNAGTAAQGVTFTPTDTINYNTAIGTTNVTVAKAAPNVTAWPTASTITYGQTLADSTLSSGAATPVGSFAFTAPTTIPDAGTALQGVTFAPADTANYNSAVGSVNVTVDKANQTITFAPLVNKTYGNAPFTLSASGGASGNPVTFISSNPAVAPVSGNEVTIVGAGITTITASQAGNANYNAADDQFQSLTVDKAAQTITFTALPLKNVGDADFAPGAMVNSSLTVTYASSNTAVATIVAGQIHIVGPGDTTITASQAGDSNYDAAVDVLQPLTVTAAGTPTLKVTIVGNGSVHSSPGGIACTGGTCSADFTSGQSVDLTAASSWNYDFAGWSGSCSGTSLVCTVTVTSLTETTATFTAKQLVRVGGDYFPSMQDAYNAAVDGAVLQGTIQILTENLLFNRPVNIAFVGGFDGSWNQAGFTTVEGTLTVETGGVTIDSIIIQ